MASMFRRNPLAKVTSLFREVFGEIATANPDHSLYVAIAAAAEECGMQEFDAEAIGQRLLDLAEAARAKNSPEARAKAPAQARGKKTSGFGAHFTQWLGGLTTEQLCLWLADYDLDKARILYCDTDIDDLTVMVDLKSGHQWQLVRTQFEACVIGFGGKLEGQSEGVVHEVDMSDANSINDMIAQMQKLGF